MSNVKAFITDVNRDGFHEVAEAIRTASGKDAEDINYDNTASRLDADNVQDAIDEVADDVSKVAGDVSDLGTAVNGLSGDVSDLQTAVSNLPKSYIITLPTSGYTSGSVSIWGETLTLYSIVISTDKDGNPLTNFTSGMTEDYPINVSGSQTDFNKLYAFSIGNGNVTFYLTSAPTNAFNVLIKEAI